MKIDEVREALQWWIDDFSDNDDPRRLLNDRLHGENNNGLERLTLALLDEHEAPNHDHDDAQECSRCIARAAVNKALEE